jgi:hypothetical protein
MKSASIAVVGLIAGLVLVAGADGVQKVSLHATLSGKVEVPKGDPDGRGTAEITVTVSRLCWELKVSNIGTPTAAHIHRGAPGKAGPVVVPLGPKYRAKGCATAPAPILGPLQVKPTRYYVNIHTAKYPGGAVRGQLTK